MPATILRCAALFILVGTLAARSAHAAVDTFTVLHFSDLHIGPYPASEPVPAPENVRGSSTLAWLTREVAGPQAIPGRDQPAPAPDFAVVTGDITEYGVIDRTWEIVERSLADLPCPWYAVPGNHDNTWVAMYDIMRKRHGGANHALDHHGWHFVFLCSASPQEPVPTLDATTRAWLRANLAKVAPETPIVLAMHHSPEIGEFANPAEMDTFVDLIRDHNVQLMLVGHGHSPRLHDVAGIPAVEGGSTFGGNAGYGLLTIDSERLHYAYRRHPAAEKAEGKDDVWLTLLDAPVERRGRPLDLAAPEADTVVRGAALNVRIAKPESSIKSPALALAINGKNQATLHDVDLARVPRISLPVADLTEGAHLLTVSIGTADKKKKAESSQRDVRTRVFYVDRGLTKVVWRKSLDAAVKAGPVLMSDLLAVARTDGLVTALDPKTGEERWRVATGGEILGTPAWSGGLLVFGSGDGHVYAVDAEGKTRWKHDAGAPVYGAPLIADGVVYIGDNTGHMHAIALDDGKPKWTFSRADQAIEVQPAAWGEQLCFGAWDGLLYSVNRADGTLRWKRKGPKSSTHAAFRYYAPADCGPIVLGERLYICDRLPGDSGGTLRYPITMGERLFVCDRGYHLGTFDAEGQPGMNEAHNISAITRGEDGMLYTRHIDDRVRKLSADGAVVWETAVPAGRFPVPPTVRDGRVYICSNTGLLSVLDARDGNKIWTYQTTAGFYVMAPVAVSADGVCFIAGMDGTLTALRPQKQ